MRPDFQRDFIWKEDKQGKLIESVLMRIPLPVFYLAENQMGEMVVVDGLQRLTTFQRYVNNDFALKLPHQKGLDKKRFKDLSSKLQNRIEDCNLILYTIDARVPQRALLDIFERVNSGIPLTRQQMRNCLFSGKATNFLRIQAGTDLFKEATGGSLNPDKMRDREFINRFCAFQLLGIDNYKGDMDDYLADALNHMNELDDVELEKLSNELRVSLKNNKTVFGKHAFRKHQSSTGKRSVINASLWDVMSLGLSRYPEQLVEGRVEQLKEAFYELLDDEMFNGSISLGTNQVERVNTRFSKTNEMLREVFNDNTD